MDGSDKVQNHVDVIYGWSLIEINSRTYHWIEPEYDILLFFFFSGDLYEIGKEKDPVLADMYLEVVYMQRKLEYLLASTVAGLQSPRVEANNHSI